MAHPIIATTVALAAFIKLADYLSKSTERAREQLKKYKEEVADNEKRLSSLNNQLEETSERISELESKDSLTFTEESELENLRQQNAELQREYDLLVLLNKESQKKANRSFVDTINKDLFSGDEFRIGDADSGNAIFGITEADYIDQQFKKYVENAENGLDKANEEVLAYFKKRNEQFKEDSSGISYIPDPTTEDERKVNEYLDYIADFQNKLAILLGENKATVLDWITEDNRFKDVANDLKELGKQGQVTAKNLQDSKYKDFIENLVKIGVIADDSENSLNLIARAFNEVSESAGNAGKIFNFDFDLGTEADGISAVLDSIKDSVASTSLAADSVQALTARYKDLKDFDAGKLFENTANGIHLNTQSLRKLEAAYEKQNKKDIQTQLLLLTRDYNLLTKEIDKTTDAEERANLYRQRNEVQSKINDTNQLAAEYEGLTSAFYKWENAQKLGEEGDTYDNLADSLENIKKLYDEGLVGTEKFRTAVQLMSNEDLSLASVDELVNAYEKGYSVMTRYFTDGQDGCKKFLEDVQELNSEWVHMNEDGSWEINFNDEEVADAIGINVESIQSILKKLSDYGFEINLDSAHKSLELLTTQAEKANKKLIELGLTDLRFDFYTEDIVELNEQIDNAKDLLNKFKDSDGKINLELEGAEDALDILETLIYQKQALDKSVILSVDTTNANTDIENIIKKLQEFKSSYNKLEVDTAVGADTTEAQTACDNLLTEISDMDAEILAKLGVDTTSIDTLNETIGEITPEIMVTAGLDASLIEDYQEAEHTTEGTVIWDNNIAAVTSWINQAHVTTGVVRWINDTTAVRSSFNATGRVNTATVNGTALASGNWGLRRGGKTLVGELGREAVINPFTGQWYTVGDNGAEFVSLPQGAIVFNHKQTEQLFRYGKINGRASALLNGTALSSGSGSFGVGSSNNSSSKSSSSASKSSGSSSKSSSSSSGSSSDEPEKLDWIEILLNRISEALDRIKIKADSIYKTLFKRNNSISDEISLITDEIETQRKAYNRYMQEANSVGLSSSLAEKVRNGTIDIREYDKETAELIKSYKEWFDKATECSDAIAELHENLAELYTEKFNNITDDFTNQLELLTHLTNTTNTQIDALEAKGYLENTKYYAELQNVERQNIATLTEELNALEKAFSEAMSSGEIEERSSAWYDMRKNINEVRESIDEANLSLLNYSKTMREIEWSHFDYLNDRIESLTNESDFLIGLLSGSSLYGGKGRFNSYGMATLGLRGQNYNVYMSQADQYAQEIRTLNRMMADDPYNTDLIERREQLLKLQQQSIKAAEDEKQAIVTLVEGGIKLELESLKNLIDAYTDSLDSAKSLNDYQKKVNEQSGDIAKIRKQIAAYEGDSSEENRKRLQQLRNSLTKAESDLAETEYDRFISETKNLLNDLYDDYDKTLNARLSNVDTLITDMIDTANKNADSINGTINGLADSLGYSLTDSFKSIWDGSADGVKGTLSKYGDGFTDSLTSIQSVLDSIRSNVAALAGAGNISPIASVGGTGGVNSAITKTKDLVASQNKSIVVGGLVNASGAKIYAVPGGKGYNQYFGDDPIYTVLSEEDGYIKVRYHNLSSGMSGYFKKSDVKAYKTGGLVNYTGLAQLDGTFSKPELVLNSQDTQNFIALKDYLRDISLQQSGLSFGNGNYINGVQHRVANLDSFISRMVGHDMKTDVDIDFGGINISIDHVQDYNDFVRQIQKDSEFAKMIQSMTIDKIFGGSPLKKYKHNWR